MNAKTIAATLVVIGGMTVGASTAYATPGNGNGPGNDGGCGNGQGASQGCAPDNGSECSNGQHSGNPHCDPDEATPTPTVVPTVEPTVTPTVVPVLDEQPLDPCDGPRATLPANCFSVLTPAGETLTVTVTLPTPTVEAPQPVFTFGNYPQPPVDDNLRVDDFEISQISSLPHAGDGSSSEGNSSKAGVTGFLGGALGMLAFVVLGRSIGNRN